MAKAKLNDVTDFVVYDSKNFVYKLDRSLDQLPFQFQELLKNKVDENTHQLLIPTIDEMLLENYPFVDKPNDDVVNKIISRNRKILNIVGKCAENKRSEKLDFDDFKEKDRFIVQLAKEFVFDLNRMIYKYEIDTFFANRIFINNDVNNLFIGTIPMIGRSKNDWYIFSLKMSRTNFVQKYMAELFLDKKLLESNTKFVVKEMFVLNPRQERYLLDYYDISTGEKWKLENFN